MRLGPADIRALQDRFMGTTGFRAMNAVESLPILEAIMKDVEPRLVITDPGGGVQWLEAVSRLRVMVRDGMRGIAPGGFEEVADLAEKYLPAGASDAVRLFPFMRDAGLRRVAEDDWTRSVGNAQRDDGKGTAISAGAVVEAVIADILLSGTEPQQERLWMKLRGVPQVERRNIPLGKDVPAISKWSHAQRLLAVGPAGLAVLSDRTHDLAHTLRDWRNAVHPENAAKEPRFTPADGRLAIGLAEKALEEVEGWARSGATLPWPT